MPRFCFTLVMTIFFSTRYSSSQFQKVIQLNKNRETILMPHTARVKGGFQTRIQNEAKFFYTKNWNSIHDTLIWHIDVSENLSGEYLVYGLLKAKNASLSLHLDDAKDTLHYAINTSSFDRKKIGMLHLTKGKHTLKLFSQKPNDCNIFSLELITEKTKKKEEKAVKRLRSDTQWMREAGYGIMFHWTGNIYPSQGDILPYEQAVDALDTDMLAKKVYNMGAGYLIFTTSHASYHFPAPIKAIDAIHRGHTTKRDLIDDLHHSLNAYGIKLILYYHLGHDSYRDPKGWWHHLEHDIQHPQAFWKNWKSIISEVGQRYGKKVSGFCFDDGIAYYPLNPDFQKLGKIAKKGNPKRLIAYNSWSIPKVTSYQDFVFGEGSFHVLLGSFRHNRIDSQGIRVDDAQGGLQAHLMFPLEENWFHGQKNTPITAPKIDYNDFKKNMLQAIHYGIVPTVNMKITQDGYIGKKSFEFMKQFKKDYQASKEITVLEE